MVSRPVFVELEGLHEAQGEERAGQNRAISEAGFGTGVPDKDRIGGSQGLGANSQAIEHGSWQWGSSPEQRAPTKDQ